VAPAFIAFLARLAPIFLVLFLGALALGERSFDRARDRGETLFAEVFGQRGDCRGAIVGGECADKRASRGGDCEPRGKRREPAYCVSVFHRLLPSSHRTI